MTRKIAYFGLAGLVAVVMAAGMVIGTAGTVLADDNGMDTYAPADSSVSGQPEQGVELSDAGGIREPIETGALPDASERVVGHDGWVNMDVAEQNSSPELRGLSNIQEGGGGD